MNLFAYKGPRSFLRINGGSKEWGLERLFEICQREILSEGDLPGGWSASKTVH
jgi:hypothetical protein